jgi:signal transduction histidine kinase
MRLSLRTKGLLVLGVLFAYGLLSAWFLTHQRRDLMIIAQQVNSHDTTQAMLAPTSNMLAHTLVQTQAILSAPGYTSGPSPRYGQIAASLDPLMERLRRLAPMDTEMGADIGRLDQAVEAVRAVPSGRNVAEVRDVEQVLSARLNDTLSSLQRSRDALAERYHDKQQFISVTAIGTSIAGALASAAVILIFFTRLARDIERLQVRASAIVSGYAGPPLVNRRHDEVGGLIDAVNRMQGDLRRSEQQQEITRQQRFHQEKMAAVGSMAAAIGHEVSNPIAAIAGIAQYMIGETQGEEQGIGKVAHDFGVQILGQTERISQIMRQLANLTRAHSPEPELLDLNDLVQSTCGFISFDRRFRGIRFEQDLDHDLPAVTAVADHMTQVLMNLLINAADAMENVPKDGQARIRISTLQVDGIVRMTVTDTGHGMSPEVMARAFEESFTTKPAGKGRGIGLFLCKTIVEQAGARIELESVPGAGTTASLFLPLTPGDKVGR